MVVGIGAGTHMVGYAWASEVHPLVVIWILIGLLMSAWLVGATVRCPYGQPVNPWCHRFGSPYVLVVCAVASIGLGVGAWDGCKHLANLDAYLGKPVSIQALVTSSHPVRGGLSAVITIQSVQPSDGQGLVPPQGTAARATWLVWGGSRLRGLLSPGRIVTARGVLDRPPLVDGHGRPLRASLSKFGIDYEWSGRLVQGVGNVSAATQRLRSYLSLALQRVDPTHKQWLPLLDSVLFGGGAANPQLNQEFLAAGLLHVLAASGANVLLITESLERALRPIWRTFRLPRLLWTAVMLMVIWGFDGMCGNAPSIVRASIMASYRQVGNALGRTPDMWQSTLLALLVMSFGQASVVSGTSSVLSFTATVAVAVALQTSPRRGRRRGRLGWFGNLLRKGGQVVWITGVVELALLPLAIYDFGQVTPYSVLSNLVAEPILFLLLPISALYLLVGAIAQWVPGIPVLCVGIGTVVGWLFQALVGWATWVSHWHGAIVATPTWPLWLVLAYFMLLALGTSVLQHPGLGFLCYNQIEAIVINFTKSQTRR